MRRPSVESPSATTNRASTRETPTTTTTTDPSYRQSNSNSHGCYRIAMVCDFFYPRIGGVENHIFSLSQHLIQRGHKVIIITHAYDDRKGVRYLSTGGSGVQGGVGPLKVYHCPILPMTDQDALPTFTATLPLMRAIFLRERIEIVHAHQATSTMANESIVYAGLLGIPSVYTDHSLFALDDLAGIILSRVLQTTMATVDAAICVSQACKDNFILRTHLNPAKVHVIPNAVDPSRFYPSPTTQMDRKRIKVVVVSRLVYRKGVDLLLGIIPAVCHQLDHVDFIVGGDGNKFLELQSMIQREQLENRVTLLGAVPHADVRNVLIQGHVFLNCSLTESFCIAILEAASCGLMVVSTNVGGIPEVLPEHEMIYLAHPNVSEMTQQLIHAVQRQSSKSHAVDPIQTHNRVKQMYSWESVAKETEIIYQDIVVSSPNDKGRKRLMDRLACYNRSGMGLMARLVVGFLAVTLELWLCVIEWWQPVNTIDVVPDLVAGKAARPVVDEVSSSGSQKKQDVDGS